MDINLFFRVIRRFKLLVAFGVFVAALLALLSFARITSDGLAYRQPKQWSSVQQLSVSTDVPPQFRENTETPLPQAVAQEYSTLATTVGVTALIRRDANGKPPGKVLSSNVPNGDGSASRFFQLEGVGTSKATAIAMVNLATRALEEYLPAYNRANYPPPIVIRLKHLGGPKAPELIKSPSKTRPTFVFLAVLMAFIGLAFILENVRPAVRVQAQSKDDEPRQMSALRASDRSR
jgi:hypothetical protein